MNFSKSKLAGLLCILFSFCFVLITKVEAQIPQNNLVAHYDMTDKMSDISGNSYDGTISRVNKHTDISGEGIGSFRFNSKKDLITIPVNVNQSNMSQYTLAGWYFFNDLGAKNGITHHVFTLMGNKDGSGNGLWLGFSKKDDKNGYWAVSGEGVQEVFVTNEQVKFGEWIFVAITVDYAKNNCVLYINGKRFNTNVKIGGARESVYLGDSFADNKRGDYIMDEVFLYDKALTSNEIKLLRTSIDVEDTKKNKKDIAQFDYFEVLVDSTRIKSAPNVDTEHLGFVYQGDSIPNGKIHKNEGRGYYKWLEYNHKGRKGYLIMANLKRQNPYADKPLNKQLFDKFGFYDKKNWTILLIVLFAAYLFSFKFSWIDSLLGIFNREHKEGAGAALPIMAGGVGAVIGFFTLFFERQTDYFYHHFTLLPVGYGMTAWVIMLLFTLLAVYALSTIIGSILRFGIIHGLIRIAIIAAFSAITFFGTLLVTMVAIVVAIGVVAFLFFGNAALLQKVKIIYSDGSSEIGYI